jgi:hypothetical protein
VSAGVPIIDLDVAGRPPDAEARRRRPVLRPSRPVLVVAVVLLALAGLGPAAPPGPALRLVLAANGTAAAAFDLGAESLYTASYGAANPNSESAVRRFDLTDGSLRWAAALPQGVQNLNINDAAGVLMARSGTEPRITFLDADTGQVLWRLEAANTSVLALSRLGALIVTDVPGATELRLAGPRDARTHWTRRIDSPLFFGPGDLWSGDSDRIVVLSFAGTVRTLDLATGEVLGAGGIGAVPEPNDIRISMVGRDRLIVSQPTPDGSTVSAFSLAPFARLWHLAGQIDSASDCGPLWCLSRADQAAVEAVDPDTGAFRWRNTELASAARWNDRFLTGFDRAEEPRMFLLDPATGRVVRRLGPTARAGDLLLHRDTEASGRSWVSVLGERGVPYVVGGVDSPVPYGCEAAGRYVACPTTDGPTKVWRLP